VNAEEGRIRTQPADDGTARRNRPLTDPFLFEGEREIAPHRPPAPRPRRQVPSPKTGTIYSLGCDCHPGDGVRYIGQTRREASVRFEQHVAMSKNGSNQWQAVYQWMSRHGEESIVQGIVETGIPLDQLDYHEYFHIVGHRSAGDRLTNQDNFWTVDELGRWEHHYPNFDPFNRIDCVSWHFVVEEFKRGIYPLTLGEFHSRYPGVERQTIAGLAELLTPKMRAEIAEWRKDLPSIEEVELAEKVERQRIQTEIFGRRRRDRRE
jgi:hypothetical protein